MIPTGARVITTSDRLWKEQVVVPAFSVGTVIGGFLNGSAWRKVAFDESAEPYYPAPSDQLVEIPVPRKASNYETFNRLEWDITVLHDSTDVWASSNYQVLFQLVKKRPADNYHLYVYRNTDDLSSLGNTETPLIARSSSEQIIKFMERLWAAWYKGKASQP